MNIQVKHIGMKIIGYAEFLFFGYLTFYFITTFQPGNSIIPIIIFIIASIGGLVLPEFTGELSFTGERIEYKSRLYGLMQTHWVDLKKIEDDKFTHVGFFTAQGRLVVNVPPPFTPKGKKIRALIESKSKELNIPIFINPKLQYVFSKGVKVNPNSLEEK